MPRAIILEGPDESGKSTLAEQLGQLTGYPTISIGPKPLTAEQARSFCRSFVSNANKAVIMDRCTPISELVYRSQLGGGLLREMELLAYLYDAHQRARPVFVLCRPTVLPMPEAKHDYDSPELVERLRKTQDTIREAYDTLFCLMEKMGYDVRVYVHEVTTPEQLLKEIQQ